MHTIEHRADDSSGVIDLLLIVHVVCDIRGIRVGGPRLPCLRSGHGSGVYWGGLLREGGIELGRRGVSR